MTTFIGWDIGGAHLKGARVSATGRVDQVVLVPCPLWRGLDQFDRAFAEAKTALDRPGAVHAVTMTGELADVFTDRNQGVEQLCAAICRHLPDRKMRIYAGEAGFVNPERGVRLTGQVASANWRAAVEWTARQIGEGLFVDVGSTTTDLVPMAGGGSRARGYTDHSRLAEEELIYTGVARTPVMAVVARVPFDGHWVDVMAEHFANMADVYRVLERLPARADLLPSADGGPKTVEDSARRLARMIGRDLDDAPLDAWRCMAGFIAERQARRIRDALDRLMSRGEVRAKAPIVGAGVGRFLALGLAAACDRPWVEFGALFDLGGELADEVGECGPAVAVAMLSREQR